MSKKHDGPAGDTFASIRARYEEWEQEHTPAPYRGSARAYTSNSGGSMMGRTVQAAVGIGLALVLLALSAYAFYTATWWRGMGRDGAVVGYTLVGTFLLVASLGGALALWNHHSRVLDPNRRPAHH